MVDNQINKLLTMEQREELTEAAASTFVAATLGSKDEELESLWDLRDLAMSVLGIEIDE